MRRGANPGSMAPRRTLPKPLTVHHQSHHTVSPTSDDFADTRRSLPVTCKAIYLSVPTHPPVATKPLSLQSGILFHFLKQSTSVTPPPSPTYYKCHTVRRNISGFLLLQWHRNCNDLPVAEQPPRIIPSLLPIVIINPPTSPHTPPTSQLPLLSISHAPLLEAL